MQPVPCLVRFATALCLGNALGFNGARPGTDFPPNRYHRGVVTSSASLRTVLQDPEHPGIDLWNVVFDARSKRVRMYQPDRVSREAIRRIGGKLTNRMLATSGPVAEMAIDIVERPLDVTTDCDTRLSVAAYFIRPWFWDNSWHFMNDAAALSSWMRNTPGCDNMLCPNVTKMLLVYHDKGGEVIPPGSLRVTETLTRLFHTTASWRKTIGTGQRYCISSMHWGLGIRCLGTITRYPHPHTEERRLAVNAYRNGVFNALGLHKLLQAEQRRYHFGPKRGGFGPNGKALAVHVLREKKSGRFLSDDSTRILQTLFSERNVSMVPCCNFQRQPLSEILELFGRADFVIGAHGAGLSNMVFAQRGAVLVELKTWFRREQDMFRKIAQARWGGYLSVLMQSGGKTGAKLVPKLLEAAVDCAVGVWRGRPRGASGCWVSSGEGKEKIGMEGAQRVGGGIDCNDRKKTCHRAIGPRSTD
jgi:hypothetical protein